MSTGPDWSPLGARLGARSIVASLLLGMHPPRLSSGRLVRWCSLFGITENAARVALSRMVERGELLADDGIYELAGTVRTRQDDQDWALAATEVAWDGGWVLAITHDGARSAADRASFREAARHARLVELRVGVWGRPDNLRPHRPVGAWSTISRGARVWRAQPEVAGPDDVGERFSLPAWAERADALLAVLEGATRRTHTDSVAAIPDAFVAGAAALQHLRRDPLLPAALLPSGWPGDALRTAYRAYQPAFAEAVASFFRSSANDGFTDR